MNDSPFRGILALGFVALLGIGLYHRLKSWASKDKLDRRQEGLFILATLRPLGLILWLSAVSYLIKPSSMAWSRMALADWLRWVGVAMMVAGVGLFWWTLHGLGTNLTDTVVTKREHTLVTQGPYRWVRHPFYDAMALVAAGIGLGAANWFILLTGALVFLLLAIRSRTEEANLLARFGEPYRAYRERTGRFLPQPPWRVRRQGELQGTSSGNSEP